MKQKFFMLLMTVMMMLGMTQVAMADLLPGDSFTGKVRYVEKKTDGSIFEETVNDITAKSKRYEDGSVYCVEGKFDLSDGSTRMWSIYSMDDDNFSKSEVGDGARGAYEIGYHEYENGNYYIRIPSEDFTNINSYGDELECFLEIWLDGESMEPELHDVTSGFTGAAVSNRGDYDLFIAGYFSKELTDGVHELVLSDIGSQTIAIVAHHNVTNGVNRNMNQSTIEEMTVTVSGGAMISMTLHGRVQTAGGTLDRYAVTINP